MKKKHEISFELKKKIKIVLYSCCKKYAKIWVILFLAIIGISLGLALVLRSKHDGTLKLGYGVIVSNGDGCAEVGG